MFGLLAAVSSVVAGVSGLVAEASIPVVGTIVASGAEAIGTAVGTAVSSVGGSAIAGTIAGNTVQTAVNGTAIGIASSNSD